MVDRKEDTAAVVVLTDNYRIIGRARVVPDGSLWDLKHRTTERFVTIYDAKFHLLSDGRRAYEAKETEINRDAIVAIFREEELVNMRKLEE